MIGIRQEEVPVLVPHMEPSIVLKNKHDMTISTGFIQAPQVNKPPVMQELVLVTTLYNMGENRNPRRVRRTNVDVSTPDSSGSGTSDVASCPRTTPCFVFIWNGSIGNMMQTTTPNFRATG